MIPSPVGHHNVDPGKVPTDPQEIAKLLPGLSVRGLADLTNRLPIAFGGDLPAAAAAMNEAWDLFDAAAPAAADREPCRSPQHWSLAHQIAVHNYFPGGES